MNCKPGDLAVIVKASQDQYIGIMVETICLIPPGRFPLPDGNVAYNSGKLPNCWMIKIVGGAIKVPTMGNVHLLGEYGLSYDECLKPLPGIPDEEETPIEARA